MIIDILINLKRYFHLNPHFIEAFEFLQNKDLEKLLPGTYHLKDNELFAVVSECEHKGLENTKLEAHRKYIDLHYIISGTDVQGWRNIKDCSEETEFDEEKDYVFLNERLEITYSLPAGHFTIFFPEDAHLSLAGEGKIKKVVIKILI